MKWRMFLKQDLIISQIAVVTLKKIICWFKKQGKRCPLIWASKSQASYTFNFKRLSNAIMRVLAFFSLWPWCLCFIVRQLLIKLCKRNSNYSLFQYPLLCIELQPSSTPYLASHKRLWTTVAASFNHWLYYEVLQVEYHHFAAMGNC